MKGPLKKPLGKKHKDRGGDSKLVKRIQIEILGDSEEQGSLVCCSPWGCKEVDTTERLNNNHKTDGLYIVVPVSHS